MSGALGAAYYADGAQLWRGPIVENERLARDTYRVRIACGEIARQIVPGQFVMLRLADCNDPLLGRPLALFDTYTDATGRVAGIDLVYLTLGKMTRRLIELPPGAELECWGPLGNGFPPHPVRHLLMVAGGIGQTPFLALGSEYLGRRSFGQPARNVPKAERVTLLYGARSADFLAGVAEFERQGIEVRVSTDDGTAGYHGLVTDLLRETLGKRGVGSGEWGVEGALDGIEGERSNAGKSPAIAPVRIACCGPEPMMEAVAHIAGERCVPCDVSLETPMACGIGICFSCVARVQQADGAWDFKRTCVEGPIFAAEKIVW